MDLHPARIAASILLIVGSLIVGVTALAIVMAKLLVDGGMAISQSDAVLLGDLITVLPFIVVFAVAGFVAAAGLLISTSWSDSVAFGISTVAVVVGATGLMLLSIGRDPFASAASARSTNDGLGIIGDLITVLPFIVVFAVAGFVAAAGLLFGTSWADSLAFGIATVAVVIGATGLILLSIGRDPFASTASAHSTNDGLGIIGAFIALYLSIIVAVAVARLPRHISTGVTA